MSGSTAVMPRQKQTVLLAALPLAATGLLNPLIAGMTMTLSSLFVVSNSLRLRRFAPSGQADAEPVDDWLTEGLAAM